MSSLRRRRRKQRSQEGAVMLIAMVMIMTVTAAAMFSVYTTTTEIRGAGHVKRAFQTRNIARTGLISTLEWIDIIGPSNLAVLTEQMRQAGNPLVSSSSLPEPGFSEDVTLYRLYPEHFIALMPESEGSTDAFFLNSPIDHDATVGAGGAAEAYLVVDIYDTVVETKPIAGTAVDGRSRLKYLRTTVTVRGRMRVSELDPSAAAYTQGSADMRAFILSGPYLD